MRRVHSDVSCGTFYGHAAGVILGTGMAGLGAAHALASRQIASVCFDPNPVSMAVIPPAAPWRQDSCSTMGRTSRSRRTVAFNACWGQSLGEPFEASEARINNYWHGHWLTHPGNVISTDCLSNSWSK